MSFFAEPILSQPGQTAQQQTQTAAAITPYDIQYAYLQQSQKNNDSTLRFSMSVPFNNQIYVFQAHLDPNHLVDQQAKRLVKIDVLTGVVIQDFGFTTETIELKGTTGSAYYREIGAMDQIFNAQSANGVPTAVTLTIEQRTYTCTWENFTFDRQQTPQGGNLINYTMSFIVLARNQQFDSTPVTYNSPQAALQAAAAQIVYNNNQANTQNVGTNGLSPVQYVKSISSISNTQIFQALGFIQNNWNSALNGGVSYPGDYTALLSSQLITVPTNWSNVLNGASNSNNQLPPPGFT